MAECKSLAMINHHGDPLLGNLYGSRSPKRELSVSQKRKPVTLLPVFADHKIVLSPERRKSIMAKLAFKKEQVMDECPGCHRTFRGRDKVEKHMRGCDLAKAMNSSGVRDCVVHNNTNVTGQVATMSLSGRSDNTARINPKQGQLKASKIPTPTRKKLSGRSDNTTMNNLKQGRVRASKIPTPTKRHLNSASRKKKRGSKSISVCRAKSVKKFQFQQDEQRKSISSRANFESRNSIFRKPIHQERMVEKGPGCGHTFNGKEKLEKSTNNGCDLATAKPSPAIQKHVVHKGSESLTSLSSGQSDARQNAARLQEKMDKKALLIALDQQKLAPSQPSSSSQSSVLSSQEQNARTKKETHENGLMEGSSGCVYKLSGKSNLEDAEKGCGLVEARRSSEVRDCMFPTRRDSISSLNSSFTSLNSGSFRSLNDDTEPVLAKPQFDRRELASLRQFSNESEESSKDLRWKKEVDKNQIMEECPSSFRTFSRKNGLAKHIKGCNLAEARTFSNIRDSIVTAGRDSYSSLKGGLKQFQDQQQALFPPKQPKLVPLYLARTRNGGSFEETNATAKDTHGNQAMEKCSGCGRTFSGKDKLEKHVKGCDLAKAKRKPTGIRECIVAAGHDLRSLNSSFGSCLTGTSSDPEQMLSTKPPKMCVCYICGQQFGSKSISIHEPQCLKKFQDQQALLPPEERKPVPSRPSNGESFEERAKAAHEKQVMEKCIGCGRTFSGKDKLAKHTKGCVLFKATRKSLGIRECIVPAGRDFYNSVNNSFRSMNGSVRAEQIWAKAPGLHVCYICGQQFGSKSISIHEPQCLKRFQEQQALLPPKERKPVPLRPSSGGESLEDRNAKAKAAHEKQVMEKCIGCGRTFNGKDKLAKHMKGCDLFKASMKPSGIRECIVPAGRDFFSSLNSPFRSMNSSVRAEQIWAKAPVLHVCYICGQQFGSKSISIHEPQCLKKFQEQQALLPPEERKPVPLRPSSGGESLEDKNARAKAAHEKQVMEKCNACGRTFSGKDKLEKHTKGCDLFKARMKASGIRECIVPAGRDFFRFSLNSSFRSMNSSFRVEQVGGKAPALYACYICGQEFGSKSISIHEPQCLKKFQEQQALLPPEQRKPVPSRPSCKKDGESLEEWNARVKRSHENQVMERCPGCSRTFRGKDKLAKHIKGCDLYKAKTKPSGIRDCIVPVGQASSTSVNASWSRPSTGRWSGRWSDAKKLLEKKPKMHLCYICGQQFGSKSILIHEPQCLKKFKDQQALLPPEQRKPLPSRPLIMENASSLEEWNVKAKQAYEKQVMEECPGCGRTFSGKDKLEKHMKGCDHVKCQVILLK